MGRALRRPASGGTIRRLVRRGDSPAAAIPCASLRGRPRPNRLRAKGRFPVAHALRGGPFRPRRRARARRRRVRGVAARPRSAAAHAPECAPSPTHRTSRAGSTRRDFPSPHAPAARHGTGWDATSRLRAAAAGARIWRRARAASRRSPARRCRRGRSPVAHGVRDRASAAPIADTSVRRRGWARSLRRQACPTPPPVRPTTTADRRRAPSAAPFRQHVSERQDEPSSGRA
jgi:hypothetical protein